MRRPRAAAVAPLLLLLGASLSVSLSVSLSWQPAGAGEVAPPQEKAIATIPVSRIPENM